MDRDCKHLEIRHCSDCPDKFKCTYSSNPYYRNFGMYNTRELYLDAVSEEGAQALFKLYNDYELLAGIETTSDFVVPRQYEKIKEEISGGGLCFLVKRRFDKAVVGYASLSMNWITHVIRPLLFLGRDYRGKGYGKQLMALLMYVGFQEVNARKMAITVYSFNKRAIQLYEYCGFREEGRQLEDCYRTGAYWDVIYLGLFRKDWREYWQTLVDTTGLTVKATTEKEGEQTR